MFRKTAHAARIFPKRTLFKALFVRVDYKVSVVAERENMSTNSFTSIQDGPLWLRNENPHLLLRRAEDELQMALQPLVDINTGQTFGYEALVRGVERLNIEGISELFDLADSVGVLSALELKLFNKAVEKFHRLPGAQDSTLFFNLDGRSLPNQSEIRPAFETSLRARGLRSSNICIELSEAHQVVVGAAFEAALDALRAAGFLIAIDDFGTGYSGLRMLYESNPSFIKIDRFFIRSLGSDSKKRLFVEAVANIAHVMGVRIIAEGVETAVEHHVCRELGCDLLQGYFVAKPTLTPETLPDPHQAVADNVDQRNAQKGDLLRSLVEPYATLRDDARLSKVFEVLQEYPEQALVPVLDSRGAPRGAIREKDVKPFVYSRFGRDLLSNQSVHSDLAAFLKPILTTNVGADLSKLIDRSAESLEEGVLVTEGMRYIGVLPARALVKIANDLQIGEVRRQNPLTGLPGNEAIRDFLLSICAERDQDCCVAYLDFDNFKPFNDRYGFRLGDRAIQMFADLLRSKLLTRQVFIGHIGGDDFFVGVKGPASAEMGEKLRKITQRFKEEAESLYTVEDRAAGFILGKARDGAESRFPLLTCSIGMLQVPIDAPVLSVERASQLMSDAKREAKDGGEGFALLQWPSLRPEAEALARA